VDLSTGKNGVVFISAAKAPQLLSAICIRTDGALKCIKYCRLITKLTLARERTLIFPSELVDDVVFLTSRGQKNEAGVACRGHVQERYAMPS
jgi:hypothetical protein